MSDTIAAFDFIFRSAGAIALVGCMVYLQDIKHGLMDLRKAIERNR